MAKELLHGGRVKVSLLDPSTGKPRVIGIFSDVSYTIRYGATPIFVLGRTSVAKIQLTHAEPIELRMRAWREVEHGPFAEGIMPRLQDLLTDPTTRLTLIDRELESAGKDAVIGEVTDVVVTSVDVGYSIRNVSEQSFSAMGVFHNDESVKNAEPPGATDLP